MSRPQSQSLSFQSRRTQVWSDSHVVNLMSPHLRVIKSVQQEAEDDALLETSHVEPFCMSIRHLEPIAYSLMALYKFNKMWRCQPPFLLPRPGSGLLHPDLKVAAVGASCAVPRVRLERPWHTSFLATRPRRPTKDTDLVAVYWCLPHVC